MKIVTWDPFGLAPDAPDELYTGWADAMAALTRYHDAGECDVFLDVRTHAQPGPPSAFEIERIKATFEQRRQRRESRS